VEARVGLVGAGDGARRHAKVLAGFSDVRLVGVVDVSPAAAESLANDVGARPYTSVPELLDAGLDAVYVCVPPFAHGEPEDMVLDAELPMFVSTPLATTVEEAERIAARVESAGVTTAVGHHWRYLAAVERARQVLDGRRVRFVGGAWLDRVPPLRWWPVQSRSGGPVVQQATHVLDLARLLAGEVLQVAAAGDGLPPDAPDADVDGVTVATLRFRSGAMGTLGATSALGWRQRAGLEVVADGLWLSVGEDGLVVREGGDPPTETAVPGDADAARSALNRAFIDAVLGSGDDVRTPYAEALRTHRVACAVAESAATARPVRPERVEQVRR
jgi:myo-inositol 2-dehydrogenase/D-chiro-inositol 1-dehydrogenase